MLHIISSNSLCLRLKNAGGKQSKPLFDTKQAAQIYVLIKKVLFDKVDVFYAFYSRRSKKSSGLLNTFHQQKQDMAINLANIS